jgi:hypothetical protein
MAERRLIKEGRRLAAPDRSAPGSLGSQASPFVAWFRFGAASRRTLLCKRIYKRLIENKL